MKASDLFFTCKCMIGKLQRVRDESLQAQEFLPRVWNKLLEVEAVSLGNESWILDAQIFALNCIRSFSLIIHVSWSWKAWIVAWLRTSNGVQWFTGETSDFLLVLGYWTECVPVHLVIQVCLFVQGGFIAEKSILKESYFLIKRKYFLWFVFSCISVMQVHIDFVVLEN